MIRGAILITALALGTPLFGQEEAGEEHDSSRISDEVVPPRVDLVPDRTPPLLELGNPFLGIGPIDEPLTFPTGAELQPALTVFGSLRTALQTFDAGAVTTTELATRLDLFGNLQLSGTERFLVGFRPLEEDGRFTRYTFEPDGPGDGYEGEVDLTPSTLFFEGDFGEIFPGLDPRDERRLDYGFAVGRQQLTFQEGMLVNDRIDSLGITRNTLLPRGGSNLRVTGLVGWNEIHRDDNREDDDALLFGLFSEADFPRSTFTLDLAYVDDTDGSTGGSTDAFYAGAGAVQRIGHWNTAFRALTSRAEDDTPAASDGTLLFAEVSRNPVHSDDLVYGTAFLGFDRFSSAARGPETGGPLGRAGVLFAAVGLGSYGSALGNEADDSFGGALGWQTFLDDETHRNQLILEVGGRADTDESNREAVAAGFRFQRALGSRTVLRFDGFLTGRDDLEPLAGLRCELLIKL